MDDELTFRSIKRKDFHALADIIRRAWNFDAFCSERMAERLGLLYLTNCLCNQSFNMVALRGGRPVGVIMGRDLKKKEVLLSDLLGMMKNFAIVRMSRKGRELLDMFSVFDRIDEDMYKKSAVEFGGELSFFVVDENERGRGTGAKLYYLLMKYFSEENVNSFYLFTDTSCDFGFYEHMGAVRLDKRTIDLTKHNYKDFALFLYGKAR